MASDLSAPLSRLQAKRPKALALPETPLTAHFSSYQMGPLTPAPLCSPPGLDTFEVDPLTPTLTRPPLRPFPSLPQPSRPGSGQQLVAKLAEALAAERAVGEERELENQIYSMLGHSRADIQRYLAMHRNLREEQTLAREGDIKSKKPLLYLLLALNGRVGLVMGTTFLEHEVVPGQPREPGSTVPGRPPPMGNDPSKRISNVEVMGGAMLLAAGAIAALASTYLFWRKATIKRPTRAACLAAAHITALALLIIHSFLYEWVLYNRPPKEQIILMVPSAISAALFAYTVPNSLTAAETECGLMPIGTMETRMELALVLSSLGAGLKELGPGLAAQHGVSSYVKQIVSILGSISMAGGLGLAFSNARNFKSRLDRGEKLRERAAQHSVSDQGRRSSSVRRPTALPASLPRDILLEVRQTTALPPVTDEDFERPILRTMAAGQSDTPPEEWPSPISTQFDTAAGAQPVLVQAEESDYFGRQPQR